jgi:hypothetical protein
VALGRDRVPTHAQPRHQLRSRDDRTDVRAQLLDNTADPTFGYAELGRRLRFSAAPALAVSFPCDWRLVLAERLETDLKDQHSHSFTCELSRRF